jgi:hypothetical protein
MFMPTGLAERVLITWFTSTDIFAWAKELKEAERETSRKAKNRNRIFKTPGMKKYLRIDQ